MLVLLGGGPYVREDLVQTFPILVENPDLLPRLRFVAGGWKGSDELAEEISRIRRSPARRPRR